MATADDKKLQMREEVFSESFAIGQKYALIFIDSEFYLF
jgi:hypothetical protein